MIRLTRVVAIAALVIAGSTGAAATAAPPQPPPGLPLYLALGDSVANGQNSNPPLDFAGYWAEVAKWRQDGYVTPFRTYLKGHLNCLPAASPNAADGCKQLQLTNLARSAIPAFGSDPGKPGVTTQSLIDEQLPVAEKMLTARNKDQNPRNDIEVVTLTVGGNEIFDAFTAALTTRDMQILTTAMQTFFFNYSHILSELRAAAGPGTRIITMTYFNPLPYCGMTLPGEAMALGESVVQNLNSIIRTVSDSPEIGAVPAEVFGKLGAGDFFDCKHPDESGYAKITTAFETAWQSADS